MLTLVGKKCDQKSGTDGHRASHSSQRVQTMRNAESGLRDFPCTTDASAFPRWCVTTFIGRDSRTPSPCPRAYVTASMFQRSVNSEITPPLRGLHVGVEATEQTPRNAQTSPKSWEACRPVSGRRLTGNSLGPLAVSVSPKQMHVALLFPAVGLASAPFEALKAALWIRIY